MGYSVGPECPNCGASHDTIFHRCFTCTSTASRAEHALGSSFYNAILSSGDASAMANRCLFPMPTFTSEPLDTMQVQYINMCPGDKFAPEDGEIFGDGSALAPSIKALSRAGSAICQINPDGTLLKGLYTNVPSSMEQTPLASEYLAFALAAFNVVQPCTYVGDCQAVLHGYNIGYTQAVHEYQPHACAWKSIAARIPNIKDVIDRVVKTKAHRNEADIDASDQDSIYYYRGNNIVDGLAREGALLHPSTRDDYIIFKKSVDQVQKLAYHMIDVLSVLSLSRHERFGRTSRLPNGVRTAPRKTKDDHQFMWHNKRWLCCICLIRTRDQSSSVGRSKCSSFPPFAQLILRPKGHTLFASTVSGGDTFVHCSRCVLYACPAPRKLCKSCVGFPVANSSTKFYVGRTMHPASRLRMSQPVALHVLN